jgi:hypothetical protein
MHRTTAIALACSVAATAFAAHAQEGEPSARTPEPKVVRTVIEDDGARIEELRVRGQLQRVVVTPRGGAKPYEILLGEGGRAAQQDSAGASRGSAGQRVWHLFAF